MFSDSAVVVGFRGEACLGVLDAQEVAGMNNESVAQWYLAA